MEKEIIDSYRRAGEIGKEVREWSKALIKPGAKVLDVVEKIEAKIKEKGAGIAFPTNVCINDVTAHYTPKHNDTTVINKGDVVTVDLGAHVDGYISDTAYTLDLGGNHKDMLKSNQEALDAVIDEIKPGVSVQKLGETVQQLLHDRGYKPIENLTGHEIKQYDLHAGLSIPNIKVPYDWTIEEDMVLAIEPFATDGFGRVVESQNIEIYGLLDKKPTRMREARTLLKEVESREELPFAARWYSKKINPMRLKLALNDLVRQEIIKGYPILHEKERGVVSQFEDTVIVTSDGCEITTK